MELLRIMQKFKVTYTETIVREIDIEANTAEEAEQMVSSGRFDPDDAYETDAELAHVDSVEAIE